MTRVYLYKPSFLLTNIFLNFIYTHTSYKSNRLFDKEQPVLTACFKISNLLIQIRIRYGMMNSLNTKLRIKITPTKKLYTSTFQS